MEIAASWYTKAARQDDPVAQSQLGTLFLEGAGVEKSATIALRWFRRAAEKGMAIAQFNMATVLHHGHGVAADEAEAAKWYRLAAEQGHPEATNNLGILYRDGLGVPRNVIVAFLLLARARGYESTRQMASTTLMALTPRLSREHLEMALVLANKAKHGVTIFGAIDDFLRVTPVVWPVPADDQRRGFSVLSVPADGRTET
jgi:TPR repeat protein